MYFNSQGKEEVTYDAIVIGSGISGGWAAKELAEKGLKTLVLERGRMVKHIEDYPTAHLEPWQLPRRDRVSQEELKDYPKQNRTGYTVKESTKHWWVKDTEHPYTEVKRFDWMRGYHVGGRSLLWGRQSYRWSPMDFESNAKDGHGVDWPIRYEDLAPWYDYVETFGLELLAGRDFDKEFGTDHLNAFVINESALEPLRFESPEDALGKNIYRAGKEGKIIGVVKDYATSGLQNPMEPVVLDVRPGTFNTFAIRLASPSDVEYSLPETLAALEKTWADFFPGKAFEYTFFDENLNASYEDESRLASLGTTFAGIAIFLSCFGLFGLISLTVQQRAKEIGIRKVLGATITGIIGLLSKDFLKLVAIAFVLATPAAYYFMEQWLVDFAYRIDLEWWHFALAGAAAVVIAFLTMSFQSIKAALMNPVESLRSE